MEETHIAENGISKTDTKVENSNHDKQINRRLLYYAHHPQFVDHRLRQLDKELSIEQLLGTGSAAISLSGILLGALSDRRWLILSALAAGLLLFGTTQRANALTEFLQKQGYRVQADIDHERYILRALRGDFDAIGAAKNNPEERIRQISKTLSSR